MFFSYEVWKILRGMRTPRTPWKKALTITMSSAHSPTFPSLHHVTTHSPTVPSLYLRHSSFSNPSVASPTSQFILQPFFCFSYVTSSSFNSTGKPPMNCNFWQLCGDAYVPVLWSYGESRYRQKTIQYYKSSYHYTLQELYYFYYGISEMM